MVNILKLGVSAAGSGFSRVQGPAELELLSNASLISLFDPAHDGYIKYSITDKVLGVRDAKLGTYWTPRLTTESLLQFRVPGPDSVPVLACTGNNMRFSGPTGADIPAGSFTLFGCALTTAADSAYFLGSGDSASPVALGFSTDYKVRIYTRYSSALALEAAASLIDNRLSLMVYEWNNATASYKLWVDGNLKLNNNVLAAPNHTDRRLTIGGLKYSSDPHGMMDFGRIAFGGVMNGVDVAFEPLLRAFAKERFPTGMAHAV